MASILNNSDFGIYQFIDRESPSKTLGKLTNRGSTVTENIRCENLSIAHKLIQISVSCLNVIARVCKMGKWTTEKSNSECNLICLMCSHVTKKYCQNVRLLRSPLVHTVDTLAIIFKHKLWFINLCTIDGSSHLIFSVTVLPLFVSFPSDIFTRAFAINKLVDPKIRIVQWFLKVSHCNNLLCQDMLHSIT